jgi:hypothetical protein
MRRIILIAGCCLGFIFSRAQKTEWYGRAGSGFYFFSGKSAVKEQTPPEKFAAPYGKIPSFSMTIGTSVQLVTHHSWLWNIGLEIQSLGAHSEVNDIYSMSSSSPSIPVSTEDGKASFRTYCIALSPSFGKRLKTGKKCYIDLSAGPEFAFNISSSETLEYRLLNSSIENKYVRDSKPPGTDFRIQFQAGVGFNRFHVFAGYARGLSNFYVGWAGANLEAYSNFIKMGIGYRFK